MEIRAGDTCKLVLMVCTNQLTPSRYEAEINGLYNSGSHGYWGPETHVCLGDPFNQKTGLINTIHRESNG